VNRLIAFWNSLNKMQVLWGTLMLAFAVYDLLGRSYFFAALMFAFAALNFYQALPPYLQRRLRGKR
jgi:hypothetical protein